MPSQKTITKKGAIALRALPTKRLSQLRIIHPRDFVLNVLRCNHSNPCHADDSIAVMKPCDEAM